jgi:hypothetical protein
VNAFLISASGLGKCRLWRGHLGLQKESPGRARASESIEAEEVITIKVLTIYVKVVLAFPGTLIARLTIRKGR